MKLIVLAVFDVQVAAYQRPFLRPRWALVFGL